MNNDSVMRGEVLNHLGDLFTLCSETGSITKKDLEVFEKIIKSLPAVPQEMTAREFAKEFRRMCDAYLNCMEDGDDCPLYTANICSLDEMENIVPIVKQWAREHPERSEE